MFWKKKTRQEIYDKKRADYLLEEAKCERERFVRLQQLEKDILVLLKLECSPNVKAFDVGFSVLFDQREMQAENHLKKALHELMDTHPIIMAMASTGPDLITSFGNVSFHVADKQKQAKKK